MAAFLFDGPAGFASNPTASDWNLDGSISVRLYAFVAPGTGYAGYVSSMGALTVHFGPLAATCIPVLTAVCDASFPKQPLLGPTESAHAHSVSADLGTLSTKHQEARNAVLAGPVSPLVTAESYLAASLVDQWEAVDEGGPASSSPVVLVRT